MTGDMGEQGHYQHSDKIKLPDKWLELFAGYYGAHRPDLHCKVAPFKVSADCCYWMKEKPADDWAKAHNSYPYLGLMASEGGQREQGLMKNGCNYFGKSTTRSCPFAIFMRQDLLQLALDLDVPVPEVYGIIERDRFERCVQPAPSVRDAACVGLACTSKKGRIDSTGLGRTTLLSGNFGCEIVSRTRLPAKKYGWGRVLNYLESDGRTTRAGTLRGRLICGR